MLLKLHWLSVSWWGNVCVMRCVQWKGCHNIIYELSPHCDTEISQDARPIIIDTLVIVNFGMRQEACCNCFSIETRSLSDLCMLLIILQLRSHRMHSQQSFRLRWRSFWQWGSDRVVYCIAKEGCHYVGYGKQGPDHFSITVHTRLQIVNPR